MTYIKRWDAVVEKSYDFSTTASYFLFAFGYGFSYYLYNIYVSHASGNSHTRKVFDPVSRNIDHIILFGGLVIYQKSDV